MDVCRHPKLLDAIEACIGHDIVLVFSSFFIKPANGASPELQSTYQLIQIHPVWYVDVGFRGMHQARTTRGTMRRFETQSVPTLSFYFC